MKLRKGDLPPKLYEAMKKVEEKFGFEATGSIFPYRLSDWMDLISSQGLMTADIETEVFLLMFSNDEEISS